MLAMFFLGLFDYLKLFAVLWSNEILVFDICHQFISGIVG
jgi:hypothetical protein